MNDKGFAILGGGMGGFGAANQLHELGIRPKLYDSRPPAGRPDLKLRFRRQIHLR